MGLDPTAAPRSTATLSEQHPKEQVSQQKGKPDQTINQISEAERTTGRRFPRCHCAANTCAKPVIIKSSQAAVVIRSEVCRSGHGVRVGCRQSSSIFTSVSTVVCCGCAVCLQNTQRQKFCLESSGGEKLGRVILCCFCILSAVLKAS